MSDDTHPVVDELLDMKPGNPVWYLNFRLGDAHAIYPVMFMGFTGGQTRCEEVVISNPWFEGYSQQSQGPDCKFYRSLFLRTVSVGSIFVSAGEAFRHLMIHMRAMGFERDAIVRFMNVDPSERISPVLNDEIIVSKCVQSLLYMLDSDPWHKTYNKMLDGNGLEI